MITLSDITITLVVCLGFIMIFLLVLKMHISNNKALLKEIDKVTKDTSIKSNYKELSLEEFNEIISELKKINFYPKYFVEIECGKCKNLALAIANGIPKAKGFENEKNLKKSLQIIEKLPKSINKNISIEEINIDNLPTEEQTLILINNKNYSEELNNKIIDKCIDKDIILILQKDPNSKMNILKKTDNYVILNHNK